MKKIGLILICILLVAALAIPAFAANATVFTVTANKTTATKGDQITFNVNIKGDNKFKTIGAALQYDKNVFELVSGECTLDADMPVFQEQTGFAAIFFKPTAAEGKLGTFVLKVISSCPANTSVSVIASAKDGNTSFPVSVNGASVKVTGTHTYGAWAPNGDANHAHTCTLCGNVETAPHAWVNGAVVTPPTCAAEGEQGQTCSDCGATRVVPMDKTEDHKFDAGKITTAPGCETKGVKTFTCENGCGKTKTEEVAATGHDYDEGKVTTAPGCETKGVKTFTCKNGCGKTKTEDVAVTGHDYDEGKITTAPGCETKGVKTFTCKNGCGKDKTEEVAAIGHDYDEGKITTAPGCESKGVKTFTCKNGCGKDKTEDVAPVGHTPAADAEVTKKPTCETAGIMTGKCGVCGKELSNQEIPALGHDYELTATVDPDCENAGSKTYVCKNDATHTYTDTIDALGHSYGEWTKVDDKDHKRICATCEDEEVAEHAWNSGFVTKEPTCSDEGEKLFTCADCGAERTEVVPATGVHTHDQYVDNLDDKTHNATCACGDTITEDHAYVVKGDILVKPTTSAEGQQEMLCACGAKTVKTLPKLSADLDDVPETGDITGQIVIFAVAVVAAMTAAGFGLKRKFAK